MRGGLWVLVGISRVYGGCVREVDDGVGIKVSLAGEGEVARGTEALLGEVEVSMGEVRSRKARRAGG